MAQNIDKSTTFGQLMTKSPEFIAFHKTVGIKTGISVNSKVFDYNSVKWTSIGSIHNLPLVPSSKGKSTNQIYYYSRQ